MTQDTTSIKIETIRAKNIASRDKKIHRAQEKIARKEAKSAEKSKKMDLFSVSYAKKRADYIEKKTAAINKRYEIKVNNSGLSLYTKFLKWRLNRFHGSSTETGNSSLAKKIEILTIENKAKLEKYEQKRIANIDNDLRIKYYGLRLKYLQALFAFKQERLDKKVRIASIDDSTSQTRAKRLQIDEATAYLRWDKKIAAIKDRAQKGCRAVRVEKLIANRDSEIKAMRRRAEMPPAFTPLGAVKDVMEIAKSHYLAGFEIRGLLNRITSHLRKFSMYYVFIVIVLIFGGATTWTNLKSDNIVNIIESNVYILLIGLSMLLVIVAGAIDLSVGSMLGFCGALSVYTYNQLGGNLAASVITTLLFGTAYGFFQGFLIGYFKMPSFIVTLGGMLLFSGLVLILTNGTNQVPLGQYQSEYIKWVTGSFETPSPTNDSFHLASFFIIFGFGLLVVLTLAYGRSKRVKYGIDTGNFVSFLIKVALILGLFAVIAYFIGSSIFGLRYYMLCLLVFIAIFMFVTQNTTFGRAIYAVGGNKKAAFLSGINVARTLMFVFAVNGLMTAFGSLFITAIAANASTSAGAGYELNVISAVFVGGASMTGGIGTIAGTLIGGLALGFINNGISVLLLSAGIQFVVRASILIAAVGYDVYSHRKIG